MYNVLFTVVRRTYSGKDIFCDSWTNSFDSYEDRNIWMNNYINIIKPSKTIDTYIVSAKNSKDDIKVYVRL